ncbi:transcription termination factor 5, mitochondrial [Battus philenor]|uniref:transcription termination factor 5, mitochondrial n=1 Tax=Battus philenor TaxID=42288 RepID=UPI0035D0EAF9
MEPVTPENLLNYINIIKRKTIGELKSNGCIPSHLNVENRLASFMTQWPTSLTTLIYGDVNTLSLYSLRLKIIQRYLELLLDINSDEFNRGLQTYPTIKHRPLEVINEVLKILQSEIMMPNQKIKANLFLIHADSENLRNLIYNFRFIGGIDIKEVIRLHPRIAMRKYQTMLEIKNILQEFNISKEAQTRCFEIYTLSPATIRERLEKAKNTPDFITYFEHPRFLKIIYYNKTATKRLLNLYNSRKNCVSLNVLSSSNSHYEAFQKAPGDCFGKGKDTVFFIHQILQNAYTARDIRNSLKKHPFWINVPLIQMKFVADLLLKKFSAQDIFDNCFILLYPWKKICDVMYILNSEEVHQLLPFDHLDLSKITNSQKLSLMLYLLEKNHYFSGNGVWIESKNKNSEIADQNESNYYLK